MKDLSDIVLTLVGYVRVIMLSIALGFLNLDEQAYTVLTNFSFSYSVGVAAGYASRCRKEAIICSDTLRSQSTREGGDYAA
jgi:hypothetical protein